MEDSIDSSEPAEMKPFAGVSLDSSGSPSMPAEDGSPPGTGKVRRVVIQQRLALLIYGSALLTAGIWAFFVSDPPLYLQRVLLRLLIVGLVALGGLGWALETRRLDHAVQQVRADLLEDLVMRDDLTGLSNRRAFFARLQQEWLRYQRYGRTFSVIMLDLDHFKQVNDRYGHPMGDRSLKWLSLHLAGCLRRGDLASRLGGDEFALLLLETPADGAAAVLERLQRQIAADDSLVDPRSGETIHLQISGGVASPSDQTLDAEHVLLSADTGLYNQKAFHSSKR